MTRKPYTASNHEIYSWAIGGIASHALICTFGRAMNIFTVGFGLSAVLVSWAMTLPRVVDAILNPILGPLSDDTHTRWDAEKPYLLASSVLGALFVMGLWWAQPDWSPAVQSHF